MINSIPAGRKYGVLHHAAYHGKHGKLQALFTRYGTALNLDIKTADDKKQTPRDIARLSPQTTETQKVKFIAVWDRINQEQKAAKVVSFLPTPCSVTPKILFA